MKVVEVVEEVVVVVVAVVVEHESMICFFLSFCLSRSRHSAKFLLTGMVDGVSCPKNSQCQHSQ